jgi:hypothetical protein
MAGFNKLVVTASRKPLKRIRPFAVPHSERAISCLIMLGRKEVEVRLRSRSAWREKWMRQG